MASLKVAWQKLNVNWVLRSEVNSEVWFLREVKNEMLNEGLLEIGNQVPLGAGEPVTKKKLENSESLKEAAIKIYKWTYDKFLEKEICLDHQPLINNRRAVTNGKCLIKMEDVPEVDFGPDLDVKTLKEMEENLEMLDEENVEENRKLTANLLSRLKRNRPLPENEACECRSKIRALKEAKNSFKNFKTFLRSVIIKVENNTVNRLSASTFLYEKINMNNSSLLRQLKAANPQRNCLLNARCTLLRQKIRFRIFYTRLDLFRMKIKEIKEPSCLYCKNLESTSINETLRHLLTECKMMVKLWEFFRNEIREKWDEEWSDAEMIYVPSERTPTKMKTEYVFLRLMNRFMGLRSEGNFDSDVVTPLKKTCEELMNILIGVFDDKFGIEMDRTTMQGSLINT